MAKRGESMPISRSSGENGDQDRRGEQMWSKMMFISRRFRIRCNFDDHFCGMHFKIDAIFN